MSESRVKRPKFHSKHKRKRKSPIHTNPCLYFDVIKTNARGKRQHRTLVISHAGVSNMNGNTCQWFVEDSDVYSITQDKADPRKFVVTFLHRYNFEADSGEQVDRIVDAFRALKLGQVHQRARSSSDGCLRKSEDTFAGAESGGEERRPTSTPGTMMPLSIPRGGPKRPSTGESSGKSFPASTSAPATLSSVVTKGHSRNLSSPEREGASAATSDDDEAKRASSAGKKRLFLRTERPTTAGIAVKKPSTAPSSPSATPPMPSPGYRHSHRITIQDFELIRVLGRGSFGKVLLARKKDTGERYALKVLKKRDVYKRNQNTEKTILSQLEHPFIVRLHYSFQSNDKLYMCLDYIAGGELFYHLRKAGRFPEELARFYIAEVILALEFLHGFDIVYRDLKPENILLDEDGHIRITDFGLSKTGISGIGGGASAAGSTTKTFCGTPEYLAPEIITGVGHGKAVDWWSVGILLFEMLTGSSPFYSQNRSKMYLDAIKAKLEFPPYVSAEAESLLRGLLVRRPEERLGSGPTGAAELKTHAFFRAIDWAALERKQVQPPWKPELPPERPQVLAADVPGGTEERELREALSDSTVPSPTTSVASSFFTNFSFSKDTSSPLAESLKPSTTVPTSPWAVLDNDDTEDSNGDDEGSMWRTSHDTTAQDGPHVSSSGLTPAYNDSADDSST